MRINLCLLALLICISPFIAHAQSKQIQLPSMILKADFERVKDAIPDLAKRYRKGSLQIKALTYTDSTASFEIREGGEGYDFIVDDEKKFNKIVEQAKNDPDKPSIHILYGYELKDKSLTVKPPKKPFFFTSYTVVWELTLRKMGQKETFLKIIFKEWTKEFIKNIQSEFDQDTYYENRIIKSAVDDLKMRHVIKHILLDELHVEQDYADPMLPKSF